MTPVLQRPGAVGDDALRVGGKVVHRRGSNLVDGVVGVELEGRFAARANGDAGFNFDWKEGRERLPTPLDPCSDGHSRGSASFMLLGDGGGKHGRTERTFPLGGRFDGGDGAQPGVAFEKSADDVVGGGSPQRRPCRREEARRIVAVVGLRGLEPAERQIIGEDFDGIVTTVHNVVVPPPT